jgi:hypothetical protein
MNTKMKIATGVAAGLIAGATLMGTAFAATRDAADAPYGRWMLPSPADTSSVEASGTYRSMLDFMARYRAADGSYDMFRMMGDVASGAFLGHPRGTAGTRGYRMMGGTPYTGQQPSAAPLDNTTPRSYRGPGMMGGTYVPAPGSMMGGSY